MTGKKYDIFGGLFDIDGDGKTSIEEEVLAYLIFQEMQKEETPKTDEFYDGWEAPDYMEIGLDYEAAL